MKGIPKGRLLVVVAHPDDETVGAGALLARSPEAVVVHVTDGAPRDPRFWGAGFLGSRAEYAAARRRELEAAMDLAGIGRERLREIGLADQEAAFAMAGLAHRIADLCREIAPDGLLTLAYEGGHPDHDATALATRAAVSILAREGERAPDLLEMALYHAGESGGLEVGFFLPAPDEPQVTRLDLSPEERDLKQRMVACFETQRETLSAFPPSGPESFRPAPVYDFTRPPHPGRLQYERWGFPLTGERWRQLAREALELLPVLE